MAARVIEIFISSLARKNEGGRERRVSHCNSRMLDNVSNKTRWSAGALLESWKLRVLESNRVLLMLMMRIGGRWVPLLYNFAS